MNERRFSKQINVGGVRVGGNAPIPVQSMTNTFTEDTEATLRQIRALADAGCEICRCTVPTEKAASSFGEIKKILRSEGRDIPLVADIHFDFRLALAAIANGADKIRINPGNIGGTERIKAVTDAAGAAGIPIRVGVNGGSLEKHLLEKYGAPTAAALAESAIYNAELLENMGFSDIVVSIKSTDVRENIEAHRIFAKNSDLPLHIGLTEAGTGRAAAVKSAVGIGALLLEGIGDTLRVSMTGDPVTEVAVGRDILRSTGLLPGAIELISCPTCGRTKTDLEALARDIADELARLEAENAASLNGKKITVALMGCAVNGPGEASHADLGVACGENTAVYFENGKQIKTIGADEIKSVLIEGTKKLLTR